MSNYKDNYSNNSNQASRGGESQSHSKDRYIDAAKIQPVQAKPLEVKVHNNFDKSSKAFRAIVQKERILSVYKEKQSFEKPSDKKRRKKNESRRKAFELSMKNSRPEKKRKFKEER